MKKLKLIPIREMDVVLANSLEIIRGGATISCKRNTCQGNSGNCDTNSCNKNNLDCEQNGCIDNLCSPHFVVPPCVPNACGCGSVMVVNP